MMLERSTPVEQGLNTEKLCSLIRYIKESHVGINSLMILKNGTVVTEAHFYPHHKSVEYEIENCTMAVISILIGIAIKEGLITGVKDRIVDFFPEIFTGRTDYGKEKITIEHLLTMSSGLEWNDVSFNDSNSLNKLWNSDNQIEFILDRPAVDEPGTGYNHNMGGIHLLSAILQKATGMPTPSYALEKLFRPLGIAAPEWAEDRQNVAMGFYGLCLKLEDMAKIGQLYLQKGKWNGIEIVPESWVKASTERRMETPEGPWSYYGCGYVWSLNRFGGYCIKSLPGYSIYVLPRYSLVIAVTGALLIQELHLPETLIETYILPAARFTGERGNASSNQEKLDRLLAEISSSPEPKKLRSLPKTAARISGITYCMEPGIIEEKFTFHFEGKAECRVVIQLFGKPHEVKVGLDDVFRVSATDAYKGLWENQNTFILYKRMLRSNGDFKYKFTFEEDKLTVDSWASFAKGEVRSSSGKPEKMQ